jgi:hypothetical protein
VECEECGAPAEVTGIKTMRGVDFDGSDALFTVETVHCAAGHRYIRIVEELTVHT